MNIRGKRVLITGASRGIGRELARGFAAAGAHVALVARSEGPLRELAAQLGGQALPGMLERGLGHVVNISSFGGVMTPPMLATYGATKAFVTHHSVSLRFELKDTCVGVTKVEIGEVSRTDMVERSRGNPEFSALMDRMGRLGLARQIRPDELTPRVIRAVEKNKASVRLPRRLALNSFIVDTPRRVTWAAAYGLTTPPIPAVHGEPERSRTVG